jgi:hypothetical protein
LEILISKYKINAEEAKRNYDYLLNNYKSAEKLSYFQNKVSQLSEEKAVILQTNAEAIKNLSNEIIELNIQLNAYKKKELEHLKITPNDINIKADNQFIDNKKDAEKIKINHKQKVNKAELFFEKELVKEKKETKNLFDNDKNDDGLIPTETKKNKIIEDKYGSTKDDINENIRENAKENKNTNVVLNEKTSDKKLQKKEYGFFTRFIAPIFLTENELNNLSQD